VQFITKPGATNLPDNIHSYVPLQWEQHNTN